MGRLARPADIYPLNVKTTIFTHMVSRFYIAFLICVLMNPLEGYVPSPRILVTLGPKCTFSIKALSKEVHGVTISGSPQEIKKKIKRHNKPHRNHLLLLDSQFDDLALFAKHQGYRHVHLNSSYASSLKKLKNIIATTPTTEADLPKITPHDVGLFYDITLKITRLLTAHKITHWATCGTLLGVIRHKGMIPWDDDVDIAIFEKDVPRLLALKKLFVSNGLEIAYHPRYDFWKIYPINGKLITNADSTSYPWKYPFVDIFPLAQSDEIFTYAAPIWRDWQQLRKRDHYPPEDLQTPLPLASFGPLLLPIPHNAIDYLNRMYGKKWNDVAYVSYSHQKEQFLPKIKVDLINRSAPIYFLPPNFGKVT